MAQTSIQELLRPEYLHSIKGLELLARLTVDSVLPGLNQSRRSGSGQEFSQYRNYQPGDDLRLLDWKLFARSDRFYVREAELETNLTVRFVLDASNSMRHEDGGIAKIDYARYLIATLAWLARRQGDEIALFALSGAKWFEFTPRSGPAHFQRFLFELLKVECGGVFPESPRVKSLLTGRPGRELIFFLSDMYQEKTELLDAVRQLGQTQNEVILLHLLGQNELTLDYPAATVLEDLETGQRVPVNPQARRRYQATVEAELAEMRRQLLAWQVSYQLAPMHHSPGEILRTFLQKRLHLL